MVTPKMPKLDGTEHHYNIRHLDNRVRVTMASHGVVPDHWYVSLEVLTMHSTWEHVRGTTRPACRKHEAELHVERLYEDAESVLKRLGVDWRRG